jgi:hypothetical protein
MGIVDGKTLSASRGLLRDSRGAEGISSRGLRMAKFSRDHTERMAMRLRLARDEIDVRRNRCRSVHERSVKLRQWSLQIRAESVVIREHVRRARQDRIDRRVSAAESEPPR